MKKHYSVPTTMKFPFSHAVQMGDCVYLSGQPSMELTTGQFIDGDFEAQFRQCFANLERVLDRGGMTLADVAKCTVFLLDMRDYAKMNEIYAEKFSGLEQPARSCFGVTGLPMGAKVEVEMIAYRPNKIVENFYIM